MRARYDAAQSTPDSRRHWANADGLDAVRANAAAVRARLRRYARYEVANNSYARGIVLTLANDTIGTGPRLQMLAEDVQVNQTVEREFAAWSKAVDLPAKLRTMRMARAQDGEAFAMMFSSSSSWPVSLDLRLVEADQIETPSLVNREYTEGIKFDSNGRPKSYAVLKSHPGGLKSTTEFEHVDSEYVIHWFRRDRPGQIRGIPDITPALPLFAHLRRYTLAVIVAAEIAAEWTMFLKTNASPDGEHRPIEGGSGGFDEIEIERGLMTTLPEGWEPSQLKAEQPTTTYEMFKREILNEIARCLNIPYNIAACNSSGYNYASGRLDHQTYFKSIRVEQTQCEAVVLDPILDAWIDEASRTFGFQLENRPHQWFWDGHEHVDPAKEASAQATRLASHTTTLAHEYARQGKDWETELRQRGKETALMKELGLTVSQSAPSEPTEKDREEDEVEEGAEA